MPQHLPASPRYAHNLLGAPRANGPPLPIRLAFPDCLLHRHLSDWTKPHILLAVRAITKCVWCRTWSMIGAPWHSGQGLLSTYKR